MIAWSICNIALSAVILFALVMMIVFRIASIRDNKRLFDRMMQLNDDIDRKIEDADKSYDFKRTIENHKTNSYFN